MSKKNMVYLKGSNKKNTFRIMLCILLLALCFPLIGGGCKTVQEYAESPGTSSGQIAIFLKGPDETASDITFDLQAVTIMAEDGTSRDIMNTPRTLNSVDLIGRQVLISENIIPTGRYKKLRFVVKEAFIKRKEGLANLALPAEGIFIDIDISVMRNQNVSLFLKWKADESVAEGYLFSPAFSVKGEGPELSSLLIYVTNEDSNNVSVINRQSGDVVATIMVGRKPRGIATSLIRERPRVYVANAGSNSVSVIDPTENKVEFEMPIRFGSEPEGIAVVGVSPEKELIFVANYGSDTVSVIDSTIYQEVQKINVGNGPIAIAVDPPVERLSDMLFLSFQDSDALRRYREQFFNVYVANKNSKDVSILKMEKSGSRLDKTITVNVDWSPVALTVDEQRAKVYIANYGTENLSVIDMLQITYGNTAGAVSAITNVGTSVIGVLPDPDLDRLYLLNDATNEIMIIRPFSEAYGTSRATIAPVVSSVPVGNSPRSMIMDPEKRKIYVVNRGSDTVSEVDKATRREERTIPVGKRPYGIAIFPY
jgi:YVTN family beta-propeller protein